MQKKLAQKLVCYKAHLQQYIRIESTNGSLENESNGHKLDKYESKVKDFMNRFTMNVTMFKSSKDQLNVIMFV